MNLWELRSDMSLKDAASSKGVTRSARNISFKEKANTQVIYYVLNECSAVFRNFSIVSPWYAFTVGTKVKI